MEEMWKRSEEGDWTDIACLRQPKLANQPQLLLRCLEWAATERVGGNWNVSIFPEPTEAQFERVLPVWGRLCLRCAP